jgi:hypothetical protein
LFGGLRSILSGLKPDDRVIINGQMHARPGMTVAPTDATVQVDSAAFSDPASAVAQTIPTTEAIPGDETVNSTPATQPTTGNGP